MEELRVNPEEHAFMMAETPNISKADREKTAEIMFERFKTPGGYCSNAGSLALRTNGREVGVSLDCGATASYAVSCCELAINDSTFLQKTGGRDLTKYLVALLQNERGYHFTSWESSVLVNELK